MQQTIDFECNECGKVVFNMPKIKVQRHILHHKIEKLSEVELYRISHKDYNIDYFGQTIARIPKGTLPKGW